MFQYPDEIQTFEAASKLLSLIRGGNGTRADYFHCGYVLEGFALKQILGQPTDLVEAMGTPLSPDETLETVIAACDSGTSIASVAALPPGFWRMVWELAKQIIDQWLSRPTAAAPSSPNEQFTDKR